MEKYSLQVDEEFRISSSQIINALQAYKKSELLFALHDLGILEELIQGCTVKNLLSRYNLQERELKYLLLIAKQMNLLSTSSPKLNEKNSFESLIVLEKNLSQHFTGYKYISDAVSVGISNRAFNKKEISQTTKTFYQEAMYGKQASIRVLNNLRNISQKNIKNVLEMTSGPALYLDYILSRNASIEGTLFNHYRWSGLLADRVSQAISDGQIIQNQLSKEKYDLCVISGVLHHFDEHFTLNDVLSKIKKGGILIIDDLFLPDDNEGVAIGIDWLIHGGITFPFFDEFISYLEELKLSYKVIRSLDKKFFKSVLINI